MIAHNETDRIVEILRKGDPTTHALPPLDFEGDWYAQPHDDPDEYQGHELVAYSDTTPEAQEQLDWLYLAMGRTLPGLDPSQRHIIEEARRTICLMSQHLDFGEVAEGGMTYAAYDARAQAWGMRGSVHLARDKALEQIADIEYKLVAAREEHASLQNAGEHDPTGAMGRMRERTKARIARLEGQLWNVA